MYFFFFFCADHMSTHLVHKHLIAKPCLMGTLANNLLLDRSNHFLQLDLSDRKHVPIRHSYLIVHNAVLSKDTQMCALSL